MSETEDDDGGIDKEALREELREKYESDDSERESTQRMSDLLLKGATMTNSHCNTCGDPLFRQNGTTFCPSCHGGPGGVEASAAQPRSDKQTDDGSDQPAANADGRSATDPNGQASNARPEGMAQQSGIQTDDTPVGDTATDADASSTGPEHRTFDPETSPTNPDGRSIPEPGHSGEPAASNDPPHSSERAHSNAPGDRLGPTAPTGASDRPAPSRPADGDLDAAAASLAAALERFSREAAAADDPRYARDCLEAAREAADALTALRR